ncbi:MAG TPA: VTT domain-containing protein, partial [Myxococcota bacterium]
WLSVWLVVFQTCLLFPPTTAFPLAMGGALLSALVFFALGRVLGRDVVTRLAPPKVQAALQTVSLESMIAVRLLPILPFTLVNMCCGAFGVSLRTFVVGTIVGMTPGLLAVSILGQQVVELIKHPTPQAIAVVVGVVAVLVTTAVLLRRRARRREHAAG